MGPSLGMAGIPLSLGMSCWEINAFCWEKLKALRACCPSVVVCAGLQNGLAPFFEVVSVSVFCW